MVRKSLSAIDEGCTDGMDFTERPKPLAVTFTRDDSRVNHKPSEKTDTKGGNASLW